MADVGKGLAIDLELSPLSGLSSAFPTLESGCWTRKQILSATDIHHPATESALHMGYTEGHMGTSASRLKWNLHFKIDRRDQTTLIRSLGINVAEAERGSGNIRISQYLNRCSIVYPYFAYGKQYLS